MSTTHNIKHAQINNEHHRQYKTCTDKRWHHRQYKTCTDKQ